MSASELLDAVREQVADASVFAGYNTSDQMELLRQLTVLQEEVAQETSNGFFLLVMGMVVFFMQTGFAFLEAGSVRSKNATNILLKNYLDMCFGALTYWAIGWAFAYGESGTPNPFIGDSSFLLIGESDFIGWFFQFTFCATAATIVCGAMAERTRFGAYIVYSIFLTGFVYPVVTHWAWSSHGWLFGLGYVDYAGSGVVHVVGGTAALVGAAVVGARKGRFNPDGSVNPLPGHSTVLTALGGFILWFGFLAFNGGSELAIYGGSAQTVGSVITNTILAGSAGAISSLIVTYFWDKKISLLNTINGSLGGLVSICAGVAQVYSWAAIVIGLVGGVVVVCWSKLILKMRVDDPVEAIAVHFGCGIWGVLAAPLFSADPAISVFYGGQFYTFGINVAGVLTIAAWTAVLIGILFFALKVFNKLRIGEESEDMGADTKKHKEPAYPEQLKDSSSTTLTTANSDKTYVEMDKIADAA